MSDHGTVRAYWYEFDLTGVPEVDEVLRLVAAAGKAYHSTEFWYDEPYGGGPSYIDQIQEAANTAAAAFGEAE